MRGVSTVADTVVFLLLVSAAVGTLVAVPSTPTPPRADATAETLATTTLAVGTGPSADASTDQPTTGHQRVARGTPAGLLARATLADATLADRRLLPGSFARAVAAGVEETRPTANVHVVARWRPYPNASLRGRVAVGSPPQHDAVTDVATLTVPSGLGPTEGRVDAATENGYRALATLVAERFVDHSFPSGSARSDLRGPAAGARTTERYRRFAAVTGADVRRALQNGSAATARARLTDALAARLATDMRARFGTPRQAADELRLDTVRIVVVRWR